MNWIMSFLKDRPQEVSVRYIYTGENNITKKYKSYILESINKGVQRGSNHGPVLLLLYIYK